MKDARKKSTAASNAFHATCKPTHTLTHTHTHTLSLSHTHTRSRPPPATRSTPPALSPKNLGSHPRTCNLTQDEVPVKPSRSRSDVQAGTQGWAGGKKSTAASNAFHATCNLINSMLESNKEEERRCPNLHGQLMNQLF